MSALLDGPVRKLGHGRGKYYERYCVLLSGGRLLYFHAKPKNTKDTLESTRRTYLLSKSTTVGDVTQQKGLFTFRLTWAEGEHATVEAAAAAAAKSSAGVADGGLGGNEGADSSHPLETSEQSSHRPWHATPDDEVHDQATAGSGLVQRPQNKQPNGFAPSPASREKERKHQAAVIAATATAGVAIGVFTFGVGLLAGAIVAGGAAAGAGGISAYQSAKQKEQRILVLGWDTEAEALAWRAAVKKQILLLTGSDSAPGSGGGAGAAGGAGRRRPSFDASLDPFGFASSSPSSSSTLSSKHLQCGDWACYPPELQAAWVPVASSASAAGAATAFAAAAASPTARGSLVRSSGATSAHVFFDARPQPQQQQLQLHHPPSSFNFPGFLLAPNGALGKFQLEALDPTVPQLLHSPAPPPPKNSSTQPLLQPPPPQRPPLPNLRRCPAVRVQVGVRALPLDTFVSVMSMAKIKLAHGAAEECRLIESLDDNTDVIYLALRQPQAAHSHLPPSRPRNRSPSVVGAGGNWWVCLVQWAARLVLLAHAWSCVRPLLTLAAANVPFFAWGGASSPLLLLCSDPGTSGAGAAGSSGVGGGGGGAAAQVTAAAAAAATAAATSAGLCLPPNDLALAAATPQALVGKGARAAASRFVKWVRHPGGDGRSTSITDDADVATVSPNAMGHGIARSAGAVTAAAAAAEGLGLTSDDGGGTSPHEGALSQWAWTLVWALLGVALVLAILFVGLPALPGSERVLQVLEAPLAFSGAGGRSHAEKRRHPSSGSWWLPPLLALPGHARVFKTEAGCWWWLSDGRWKHSLRLVQQSARVRLPPKPSSSSSSSPAGSSSSSSNAAGGSAAAKLWRRLKRRLQLGNSSGSGSGSGSWSLWASRLALRALGLDDSLAPPPPPPRRDFCLVRRWRLDPQTGTYIIAFDSFDAQRARQRTMSSSFSAAAAAAAAASASSPSSSSSSSSISGLPLPAGDGPHHPMCPPVPGFVRSELHMVYTIQPFVPRADRGQDLSSGMPLPSPLFSSNDSSSSRAVAPPSSSAPLSRGKPWRPPHPLTPTARSSSSSSSSSGKSSGAERRRGGGAEAPHQRAQADGKKKKKSSASGGAAKNGGQGSGLGSSTTTSSTSGSTTAPPTSVASNASNRKVDLGEVGLHEKASSGGNSGHILQSGNSSSGSFDTATGGGCGNFDGFGGLPASSSSSSSSSSAPSLGGYAARLTDLVATAEAVGADALRVEAAQSLLTLTVQMNTNRSYRVSGERGTECDGQDVELEEEEEEESVLDYLASALAWAESEGGGDDDGAATTTTTTTLPALRRQDEKALAEFALECLSQERARSRLASSSASSPLPVPPRFLRPQLCRASASASRWSPAYAALLLQALDVKDSAEGPRFLSLFLEDQRNQMLLAGQT